MFATVIAVASAFALLMSGLVQLHPPVGWVDPGLYVYWFLSPSENLAFRGPAYHGSRLPFVLPGLLLYRLLEPATAQALLVGAFHLLGVAAAVAVAAAARLPASAQVAVGFLWGLNPLVLAAFVRGYVDGPAMASALAALALLLTPRRGWVAASGAGAFLTMTASLQPFAGGLAALMVLAVMLLTADQRRPDRLSGASAATPAVGPAGDPSIETPPHHAAGTMARGLAADLAALALGGVAMLVLLGGAGRLVGFPFWFPGMSAGALTAASEGIARDFVVPARDWVPDSHRLVLAPVLAALLVAGWYSSTRRGPLKHPAPPRPATQYPVAPALLASAIVPIAVLFAFHVAAGFMLQASFYASYLLLSLVPAAVLLLRSVNNAGRAGWTLAAAVAAVSVAAILLGAELSLTTRDAAWYRSATWATIGIATAGLVAALMFRRRLAIPLAALALSLSGAFNRDTASIFPLADAQDLAVMHRALGPFRQALDEAGVTRTPYLVWLARDEFAAARRLREGDVYRHVHRGTVTRMNALDSFAATLGWDAATLGFDLPRLSPEGVRRLDARISDRPLLVALCAEATTCEEGLLGLAAMGIEAQQVLRREIAEPNTPRVLLLVARLGPSPTALPDANTLARETEGLLLDGPNGERVRREGLTVHEVRDPYCETGAATTACAYDVLFSTGERQQMELLLVRAGRAWSRAPVGAEPPLGASEPSAATIRLAWQRVLTASIGDSAPAVDKILGVACDADRDRARCVFDYMLATGERGTGELPFRRAGPVWRTDHTPPPPAVEPRPGPADVRRALRQALLDGLVTEAVRGGDIDVQRVSDIDCAGAPAGMMCAFKFMLTTGERGTEELTFDRPFTVWRRAAPTVESPPSSSPSEDAVARAFQDVLLSGPDGEALRHHGVAVVQVSELTCDGPPAATACAFDWRLSTGEQGAAELLFHRPRTRWRLVGPATPAQPGRPAVSDVRRAFEAAILAGPAGDVSRRVGLKITDIRDLSCEEGTTRSACDFAFETSAGERGATRLTLRRVGAVWRRVP